MVKVGLCWPEGFGYSFPDPAQGPKGYRLGPMPEVRAAAYLLQRLCLLEIMKSGRTSHASHMHRKR